MTMKNLPDIQGTKPNINIPIQQVGVENVEVPFMLTSRDEHPHETIANVAMGTDLAGDVKGISMSRLIGTLKEYVNTPLNQKLIMEILYHIRENVGGNCSFIKFEFRIPRIRKSPISDNEFPLYYKCKFHGELCGEDFKFYQAVKIQYASYCPCSAELSNHLQENDSNGFPHAQRSFADVVIDCDGSETIWLEDIIDVVETAIATKVYPIIKRVDEQEIARIAANNPIFVEDAIRQISSAVDTISGCRDWIVKCSHEESIHTSEAISMNWKGVDSGFDGKYWV